MSKSKKVERTFCLGTNHPRAAFTAAQIRAIRKKLVKGVPNKAEYAKELGVSYTVLHRIETGQSYRNVE